MIRWFSVTQQVQRNFDRWSSLKILKREINDMTNSKLGDGKVYHYFGHDPTCAIIFKTSCEHPEIISHLTLRLHSEYGKSGLYDIDIIMTRNTVLAMTLHIGISVTQHVQEF